MRKAYADAILSSEALRRWTWQNRVAQTSMLALVSAFKAVSDKKKPKPTKPHVRLADPDTQVVPTREAVLV